MKLDSWVDLDSQYQRRQFGFDQDISIHYFRCPNWDEQYYKYSEIKLFENLCIDNSEVTAEELKLRDAFNKKMMEKINSIKQISNIQITDKYTCQIWFNLIDFKANIQWISCQKLFCFYCFILWLKTDKNTCPNWRTRVNRKSVFINKSIEGELNLIMSIASEQNDIEWKIHHKKWDIFWQKWNREVWEIWIEKKKHEGHLLCTIENLKESVIETAKRFISLDNSVTIIKEKELNRLNKNKDLAESLKNDILLKNNNKMIVIDDEVNDKIIKTHQDYSQLINNGIEEWLEEESILKEFIERKCTKMLFRSEEAIDILDRQKKKTEWLIRKIRDSHKNPKIISSEDPIWVKFKVAGNKIKRSSEIPFALSLKESSTSITKRFKISDSSIQISLVEDSPNFYYSKIELKENSIYKLKDKNKIVKIASDSNIFNLNDFVVLDQDNQWDKILLEVTLWKETDEIKRFIRETEWIIKSQTKDSSI